MAIKTPAILYLLFSGQEYSELGGDKDCQGVYDDFDEAARAFDAEVIEKSRPLFCMNWVRLCRPEDDELAVVLGWTSNDQYKKASEHLPLATKPIAQ